MTTPSAIHQFVATAEPGAVGNHLLEVQRVIREVMGRNSEIFAEHRRGSFEGRARSYLDYGTSVVAAADDILVYHLAIGSVVADWLAQRCQTLVVVHHNLTPVEFLRAWDPAATYGVEWGQRQLPELAGRATLGIGVSSFNEAALIRAGYQRTTVAPVMVDLSSWSTAAPGPDVTPRPPHLGGSSWLFVGRLAASKCQHHLVRSLAAYRQAYDDEATLRIVGGPSEGPYVDVVRRYAEALALGAAVTLTGPISDAQLVAEYGRADIFVCLSQHEGFCVPLLEAMTAAVPIVAAGSSAVPETVAQAGLVLPIRDGRQPSALHVAAAVHRVLSDDRLRGQLIAAGIERAAALSVEASGKRWADVLGGLSSG
ncbi:MAG: glycosyltransferase family 4 protein [Acidimicrobiales bacterium]